ncbi:MAG: hypothetical protein GY809_13700, partial [Planctomycetes bacterium]|nr:hypothetical protein [Planctomycetota bacterium]
MKKFMLCIFVGLLFCSLNSAQADLNLEAVDGDWSNPTGGTDITYPTVLGYSYGNGSQDQIRWGIPHVQTGNGQKSGLGFTGIAAPAKTIVLGDAFAIGELVHFNNAINSG